jgi:hypothetical protein
MKLTVKQSPRINKANDNIEKLVSEIISMKKSEMRNYCVYPDHKMGATCNCCESCKEEYFQNLYDEMIKKYTV